ncbi:hypothetical protein [Nocardia panacis]|nr:hypothetical protein [Nocardia panacis]
MELHVIPDYVDRPRSPVDRNNVAARCTAARVRHLSGRAELGGRDE